MMIFLLYFVVWCGFVVGNVLKFMYKGFVIVSVKVVVEGIVMFLVIDVGDLGFGNRVISLFGDLFLENF